MNADIIDDRRDDIDAALVRRLIAGQFPQWADLDVRPIRPGGWDNHTFRLGTEMTVRLPSATRYVAQVAKEHEWLPQLAPLLPLPIPVPLAKGNPTTEYPWPWSVNQWIDGEIAAPERITDPSAFAIDLAAFLTALHQINAVDGPPPGPHNFWRGGPLRLYDGETRQAIALLTGEIDAAAATTVWERGLASTWHSAPVWVHGDVAVGNLLVTAGRLTAVIDFGSSGTGDPACDLAIAWTLFEATGRSAFRSALPLDDETWARGRGWALWKAVITAADPGTARTEEARRVIAEVIVDDERFRSEPMRGARISLP